MASKREQVLGALFARLGSGLSATVRRNEALPERVPPEGLVILRDGDLGEPDVTLNPRTEFHSHRVEIEALVIRGPDGGGETVLDALIDEISAALDTDPSLGGFAENLRLGPLDVGALSIEGAVPILRRSPTGLYQMTKRGADQRSVVENDAQHERFLSAAREHDREANVDRLDNVVRRLVKLPPPSKDPLKAGKRKRATP